MENATPIADEFRRQLQNELVRRCRGNPHYSLRAFARFLDLDHSSLSQYLRGRRRLSIAIQRRLAERIGLPPPKSESPSGEEGPLAEATGLTADAFAVISDWYHFAIFELVTVEAFQPKPRWIARALGITINEVHIAVERLFRLGLLRRDDEGRWRQGAPLITTATNPFSTIGFRNLQAQVLQKALRALEEIPMERRDQSSMTLAIPAHRLPEAKERIRRFRRSFCSALQSEGERDSVYQLSISFYPLTPVISRRRNP